MSVYIIRNHFEGVCGDMQPKTAHAFVSLSLLLWLVMRFYVCVFVTLEQAFLTISLSLSNTLNLKKWLKRKFSPSVVFF